MLAVAFLAGLCILLAALLAVAHRRLQVEEDARIDEVAEMLPGANCGACGVPGCRAFAEKVVAGAVLPGQCPVGGPANARRIAAYLGVDAGEMEQQVARLLCAGGADVAYRAGDYDGFPSCRAAAAVAGGPKACTFGCLGLADCMRACRFDAIRMSADGLPVVDLAACTACGDCVRACPKGLFVMLPVGRKLLVQCRSILEGEAALATCRVACTGCSLCAADAPAGLITMEHHLPVVHPDRLALQTPIATYRCPTGAITWIEGQQFAARHAALQTVEPQEAESRAL